MSLNMELRRHVPHQFLGAKMSWLRAPGSGWLLHVSTQCHLLWEGFPDHQVKWHNHVPIILLVLFRFTAFISTYDGFLFLSFYCPLLSHNLQEGRILFHSMLQPQCMEGCLEQNKWSIAICWMYNEWMNEWIYAYVCSLSASPPPY